MKIPALALCLFAMSSVLRAADAPPAAPAAPATATTPAAPALEFPTDPAKLGKFIFDNICIACHGPDAQGHVIPGAPMKMAPPLVASKIANGDPAIFAMVVLKGIQKEGQQYLGIMAPLEATLESDAKLSAALTYVRSNFGNTSAAVTPEQAKAFREQWKEVKAPVTRAKIDELSAKK